MLFLKEQRQTDWHIIIQVELDASFSNSILESLSWIAHHVV